MKGIVTTKLPDPSWGEPTIARVVPTEDGGMWGTLKFLEGTDWDSLFPRVHPDVLDQALRGYATPLMRVIGPPPRAFVKRLPVEQTVCAQRRTCLNAAPHCVPGPKLPDCWEPTGFKGTEASMVNLVVRYWRDGVIVVLVEAP